jgi:hypothetical protein
MYNEPFETVANSVETIRSASGQMWTIGDRVRLRHVGYTGTIVQIPTSGLWFGLRVQWDAIGQSSLESPDNVERV